MDVIPTSHKPTQAIAAAKRLIETYKPSVNIGEFDEWKRRAVQECEAISGFQTEGRHRLQTATQAGDTVNQNHIQKLLQELADKHRVLTELAYSNPERAVAQSAIPNQPAPAPAAVAAAPNQIAADWVAGKGAVNTPPRGGDVVRFSSVAPSPSPSMVTQQPQTQSQAWVFWVVCVLLAFLGAGGATSVAGLAGVVVYPVSFLALVLYFGFWWRIFHRAGWPGWWTFGMMVPILNLVLFIKLAFSDWPVHRVLRAHGVTLQEGIADIPFNHALDYYNGLAGLQGDQRKKSLYEIVRWCQQALQLNRRNGDAQVLLANAYFLVSQETNPPDRDMLLRAAHLLYAWGLTQPPTRVQVVENAHVLKSAIQRAAAAVLGKTEVQVAQYVSVLPPGHLEDAVRDRLSVSALLFPETMSRIPITQTR